MTRFPLRSIRSALALCVLTAALFGSVGAAQTTAPTADPGVGPVQLADPGVGPVQLADPGVGPVQLADPGVGPVQL